MVNILLDNFLPKIFDFNRPFVTRGGDVRGCAIRCFLCAVNGDTVTWIMQLPYTTMTRILLLHFSAPLAGSQHNLAFLPGSLLQPITLYYHGPTLRPGPTFRPVTPCHSPKKARIQTQHAQQLCDADAIAFAG